MSAGVLAQIKHPKAERPVFSPEFLARVKRIIVFNPLSRDAMEGIARKLFREMQELWPTRRGRTLCVPDELICHVAARAHELLKVPGITETVASQMAHDQVAASSEAAAKHASL